MCPEYFSYFTKTNKQTNKKLLCEIVKCVSQVLWLLVSFSWPYLLVDIIMIILMGKIVVLLYITESSN